MQPTDNRAQRRRARMASAVALIERVSKVRKREDGKPCPLCGALFDCEPGCIVLDARSWHDDYSRGANSEKRRRASVTT